MFSLFVSLLSSNLKEIPFSKNSFLLCEDAEKYSTGVIILSPFKEHINSLEKRLWFHRLRLLNKKFHMNFYFFSGYYDYSQYNKQAYSDYIDRFDEILEYMSSRHEDIILAGLSHSGYHVLEIESPMISRKLLVNPVIQVSSELSHIENYQNILRINRNKLILFANYKYSPQSFSDSAILYNMLYASGVQSILLQYEGRFEYNHLKALIKDLKVY